MHYRTDAVDFLEPVDDFLEPYDTMTRTEGSEADVEQLPEGVVVLAPPVP